MAVTAGSYAGSSEPNMNTQYDWERLYLSAVLETDDRKLLKQIEAARVALDTRKMELGGGDLAESLAIGNALHALEILRAERSQAAADLSKS
jgi:hypothetical protein